MKVEDHLMMMRARSKDLTPVLRPIAVAFKQRVVSYFAKESSAPAGEEWEELAEETQERKVTKAGRKRGGSNILNVTGRLMRSIDAAVGRSGADSATGVVGGYVSLGSNHTVKGYPTPAVHNFGSLDGTLPARPFLVVQDEDMEWASQKVSRFIESGQV